MNQEAIDRLATQRTEQGLLFTNADRKGIDKTYGMMQTNLTKQKNYYSDEVKKLEKELNSLVANGYIKKFDDQWFEWQDAIIQAKQEVQSTTAALADLNKQHAELILENIQGYYETRIDKWSESVDLNQAKLDSLASKRTEQGWLYSNDQFKGIGNTYNAMRSDLQAQKNAYNEEIKSLEKEASSLKKYSAEWYEYQSAITSAREEVENITASINDLNNNQAGMIFENLQTYYGNRLDHRDAYQSQLQSIIDSKQSTGQVIKASDYQKLLTNLIGDGTSTNIGKKGWLTTELEAMKNNLNKLVSDGTITKFSSEYYKWSDAIYAAEQALNEVNAEIAEINQQISQLEIAKIDTMLERLSSIRDHLNGMMDLHEVQGYDLVPQEYLDLIKNADDEIAQYTEKIRLLNKEITDNGYKKGSDKYNEILSQIEECQSAILDCKIAQEEWNDSIIDLQIKALEKQREELEKINAATDKQLKLEKALEAIEKARSQRTKLVYREGQGFVYEADQNAIKSAQEDLNDIYYEDILDKFDEAIDALEELKKDNNIYDYNANKQKNNSVDSQVKDILDEISGAVKEYKNNDGVAHYATGSKSVPQSGVAVVDEVRPEMIARGRYTWLEKGDSVFPAHITDTLWGFGSNPDAFLKEHMTGLKAADVNITNHKNNETHVHINGGLTLPNIKSGNDAQKLIDELSMIALKATQQVRRD